METPTRLENLSAQKKVLFDLLRQKRQQERASQSHIVPRSSKRVSLPLSFAQQRLWFINQLDPASPIYNVPLAVRLTGQLDVKALEKTLSEVFRRHEVLRTTFVMVDDQPVQRIAPARQITLECENLGRLAEPEREAEVSRLASAEARLPFNLAEGPLLRVRLLQLASEHHVLLLTMHHIAGDAWSTGVLIREVATLYDVYTNDGVSPLPELPVQYADYAIWQREYLQGEVLERELRYWKQKLDAAPPAVELPFDRPRPAVQSYRGAICRGALAPAVVTQLREVARREQATLFMVLLAGFNALLYRYTNQRDIVIGTPIAGRTRAETEHLIGFFVNTLVLRTKVNEHESFSELVQRAKETCLGAYAHQQTPFEKLVEELNPERNLSHAPVFQISFDLQNMPREVLELKGLQLSRLKLEDETTKIDLSLNIIEREQDLFFFAHYNRELFDARTIEQMMEHFHLLLAAVANDTGTAVKNLPLLTGDELQTILRHWNDTQRQFPHDLCLHEWFERQVELTPDSIAVRYGEKSATYRELNERANRIAHYLRKFGVGPEILVGLCTDRSIEMIESILGVLKAGAAYLPLDPSYPLSRLSHIIEDAAIAFLLTQEVLLDRLPAHWGQTICIDAERGQIDRESAENPKVSMTSENLAYVIYTSGSTGQPKGSLLQHRGACNLAQAEIEIFDLSGSSNVLQFASCSFDASVWEIFSALLSGATLCLADQSALVPGPQMLRVLREEAITMATLPPPVLAALPDDELAELRTLVSAGESCPSEVVTRWAEGRCFINAYGPTEATVCASLCDRVDSSRSSVIGTPIRNTEIYVLDQQLQPVPPGVSGQMYLGGEGLARGYLNRAILTAEKFIPHPHSLNAGARLYGTGDLARHLPDGRIEFLGRIDDQLKIRGFRVEPGEIEAALDAHESVQQSRIRLYETANGDRRLVAYVVTTTTPGPMVLRDYLRTKLPDYMVPSSFVFLSSLPLSPNGKVDYSRLPAPEFDETRDLAKYEGPRTPLEEMLTGIWAATLEQKKVGIHDSFFDLGGHSLLATQVISRVREALQIELPLRSVFEGATVAEMAELIAAKLSEQHQIQSPPVTAVPRTGPMPLSFAQQRLWFVDQYQPGGAFYNIPVAVRLNGRIDVGALERTLEAIVERHEVLRTSFIQVDGEPWQIISPDATMALPVTDLEHLPAEQREAEAKQMARQEAATPFNLASGRLLRAQLLRMSSDEHILLFNTHHIVSDGWSMSVLVREVAALYEAFVNGEAVPLPDLPVQYADFAHWQREWLQGEALESQLRYWTKQLTDLPAALELPADRPRPASQTFHGSGCAVVLPKTLTESVRDMSNREGCTMFMTLLAVFQIMLRGYSGSDDVAVGTDVANRNRGETEGLIGFFVNQLVMRTDLSGDPSFRDVLARVRETAIGAYAHQDLPFDKLVEAINPERDLSRTPLFQVKLLLQNTPKEALSLPGLTVNRFDFESGIARFDLVMSFTDGPAGLVAQIGYNVDLFERATIERMLGHFQSLLQQVVGDPQRRLSQLSLLTPIEEMRALVEWNQTERAYPEDACVHQLFEAQARRTPDSVALIFETEQVSYGELEVNANRLGNYLRSIGVGPGVLAGVCVERSVEMIVSLLGVLKAGGAYVPMDPAYPLARLAHIIDDAQISVLLTQERLLEKLPAHWGQVVCVDAGRELIDLQSNQPVTGPATADDLAYIIYTSGSTGQPKGVMVSHKSVAQRVLSMIDDYGLDTESNMLNFVSLGFDAFVEEMFPVLSSGGRLTVLRDPGQMAAGKLLSACEQHGVNSLHIVPAYLYQIIEELSAAGEVAPEWIKLCITGGENISTSKLSTWATLHRHSCRFINAYGPTETTVTATFREAPLDPAWLQTLTRLPAGRPNGNTKVYILNQDYQLLPAGIPGELFVGGVGVAWGYRNTPDSTAESFIPDPFGNAGARLYRTGDSARYLSNGEIEILGRRDGQVKIRGYRIETGEIVAALERHDSVEKALVVARADVNGDARLVAYLVPRASALIDKAEVRSFIRAVLPEYMVPSAIVTLAGVPLTPHGKIDYRNLPAPVEHETDAADGADLPRTEIEGTLCSIWQSVMNLPRVGVNSNFFDIGGSSLLAIKVMARVRDIFHIDLPVRVLFESLTVANFADVIEKEMNAGRVAPRSTIKPASRDQRLPLSFAQQRLWFIDQLEPGSPLYNCPGAVRLSGRLKLDVLERSLSEIVRRHEILRTTFAAEQGEPYQIINPPQLVKVPVIDLSKFAADEQQEEIRKLSAEEARRPFDLAAGPLLRVTVLHLHPDEHVTLFTIHHIAGDGWSIILLFREMAALYAAFADNQPSRLPELPVQYADYAVWQRDSIKQDTLEAELDYWRRQLSGKLPVLKLPFARSQAAAPTYRGARFTFRLSSEMSQQLRELSRREEATLFMTLLATFKTLLYRHTQLEDVIAGTAHANRNRIEMESMIGFFINMLVLRTDVSGNPTFRELLHRVRDVTLNAYAHQDVPFERLVEEFHTEKQGTHSPIFQVAFGLENLSQISFADPSQETLQRISELTMTPQPLELETVRYDLTLWIKEGRDQLFGWWNYATDVFDGDAIATLHGHFETLLQQVLQNPDAHLDELEMLTAVEKERLVEEAKNREETSYRKFIEVKPRSFKLSDELSTVPQ
jgi:amino acid adenylation domain-containing protein